jgi:hypothetical protein
MNKKQDEYKVKVDGKYSKYIKLAIAILTNRNIILTARNKTANIRKLSLKIPFKKVIT